MKTVCEKGFSIRRMTRNELDLAVEWAAREGWNPGLHDAECFFRCDPDGFFMGFRDGKNVHRAFAGYPDRSDFRDYEFRTRLKSLTGCQGNPDRKIRVGQSVNT